MHNDEKINTLLLTSTCVSETRGKQIFMSIWVTHSLLIQKKKAIRKIERLGQNEDKLTKELR